MRPISRRLLLRCLAAVAAGALWGLVFGARPLPLLAWVALAPLLPLLTGRAPALIGLLHGLAAWLVAIPWIAPTLRTFGGLSPLLSLALLVLLALYLALFHAAFAALAAPLVRHGGALALVGLPGLWTGLEWLRTHLLGGFPWNLAAYAWLEQPGALPAAAWIGAYGVSFLLVTANTGVGLALRRRPGAWVLAALGLLLPLTVLAIGGRWGAGRPQTTGAAQPVRLVQPDIPNQVEPDWQRIAADQRRLLGLSRDACEPGALVIWPESAGWPFVYQRDAELRRVLAELTGGGCSVLFNSPHPEDGAYYNSAYLLTPDGGLTRYDKRHLVPFGEYVPLAGIFSFIDELARNAGALRAADAVRLLPWRGERLGVAICFEVTFPGEVAELVRAGATLLVTVTNDAWYGDTSAPWQHLAAARFRAAESRRPLLRAAITGVSAVVGADGSQQRQLGVGERGVIAAAVAGRRDLSPYTRAPWLAPGAASLLGLFAILWSRRSQPPTTRKTPEP